MELTISQIENITTGVIIFLLTSLLSLLAYLVRKFFFSLVNKQVEAKLSELEFEFKKTRNKSYEKFAARIDDAVIKEKIIVEDLKEKFLSYWRFKNIYEGRDKDEKTFSAYQDYLIMSKTHESHLKNVIVTSHESINEIMLTASDRVKVKLKDLRKTTGRIKAIFDQNINAYQEAIDSNHYRKGIRIVSNNIERVPRHLWDQSNEIHAELQELMGKDYKDLFNKK